MLRSEETAAERRFAVGSSLCFLAATCLLILLLFARSNLLFHVARWLDVGEQPQKSDFIMLLTGEPNTRPFRVAELVRRGISHDVLIAEVQEPDGRETPHERARQVLLHLGIPAERVHFLPPPITSTYGEAKNLAVFLDAHPTATVTVVTNDFHTRRARWAFQQTTRDRFSQIRFVSVGMDGFDQSNWWKDELGIAYYTSEYCKLLGYHFVYGDFAWWCVGSCLLITVGLRWVLNCRSSKRCESTPRATS